MEAQSAGDKRQAISALERVLEKYDHSAPAGIHLPALLRHVFHPVAVPLLTHDQVYRSDASVGTCEGR
jgi:hypothetical protein